MALASGHIAHALLDVFTTEPAKENVLFGAPNFVATPHLGASTNEAQENVALQVAEQMSDYLLTGAVQAYSVGDIEHLRPADGSYGNFYPALRQEDSPTLAPSEITPNTSAKA